jgi:hypothetical protein
MRILSRGGLFLKAQLCYAGTGSSVQPGLPMPRMRRKGDLPEKICAACGRPFAWRRKWAANWEEVRYCSDRCRGRKSARAADSPKIDSARR